MARKLQTLRLLKPDLSGQVSLSQPLRLLTGEIEVTYRLLQPHEMTIELVDPTSPDADKITTRSVIETLFEFIPAETAPERPGGDLPYRFYDHELWRVTRRQRDFAGRGRDRIELQPLWMDLGTTLYREELTGFLHRDIMPDPDDDDDPPGDDGGGIDPGGDPPGDGGDPMTAGATVLASYSALNTPVDEALARLLDPAHGVPRHTTGEPLFVPGTVDDAFRVDPTDPTSPFRRIFLQMPGATHLDVLTELAKAVTTDAGEPAEWVARWASNYHGSKGAYVIDLVERIGHGSPEVPVNNGIYGWVNRLDLREDADAAGYFSAVIPLASPTDGSNEPFTLADAEWRAELIHLGGGTCTMRVIGNPVWKDGCLDGYQVEYATGTTATILSSVAPDTITIDEQAFHNRLRFLKPDGTPLVALVDEEAVAEQGYVERVETVPDVVPYANLIALQGIDPTGADFDHNNTDALAGWVKVGQPTFLRHSNAAQAYSGVSMDQLRFGSEAIFVRGAEGTGAKIAVVPSGNPKSPYLSAHVHLRVYSGRVAVRIVGFGETYPSDLEEAATGPLLVDNGLNGPYESEVREIALGGHEPRRVTGIGSVEVTAYGGPAAWTIEAITVTESQAPYAYQPEMGCTALWRRAVELLRTEGGTQASSLQATYFDLAEMTDASGTPVGPGDPIGLGDFVRFAEQRRLPAGQGGTSEIEFVARCTEWTARYYVGEQAFQRRARFDRARSVWFRTGGTKPPIRIIGPTHPVPDIVPVPPTRRQRLTMGPIREVRERISTAQQTAEAAQTTADGKVAAIQLQGPEIEISYDGQTWQHALELGSLAIKHTVSTQDIADEAVTGTKIADGAVDEAKLASSVAEVIERAVTLDAQGTLTTTIELGEEPLVAGGGAVTLDERGVRLVADGSTSESAPSAIAWEHPTYGVVASIKGAATSGLDRTLLLSAPEYVRAEGDYGVTLATDQGTITLDAQYGSGIDLLGAVDVTGSLEVSGPLVVDASQIDFTNLPTSDPGVPGRLWRDGNVVKVSLPGKG